MRSISFLFLTCVCLPLLLPTLHIPAKRELEYTRAAKDNRLSCRFIFGFQDGDDDNYLYVEKTKYIKDIENDRKVLMFLRPKRVRKSLLLSTFKHFYDNTEAQNFDKFGSL